MIARGWKAARVDRRTKKRANWELVTGEHYPALKIDLHRGNDIPRPRDRTPKIAFRPETVSAETETQPQNPANCGLVGSLREIFRFGRLRGGGRSRVRTRLPVCFPDNREQNRDAENFFGSFWRGLSK